jgi:hypothetical protein
VENIMEILRTIGPTKIVAANAMIDKLLSPGVLHGEEANVRFFIERLEAGSIGACAVTKTGQQLLLWRKEIMEGYEVTLSVNPPPTY